MTRKSQKQGSEKQSSPNQESLSAKETVPPTLELRLFGAPQIHLNGEPVEGLRAKEMALLFFLAVTEQPHLRTSLATLFWGEQPERNARASLRKAIQNLRRAFPNHFDSDGKSVALRSGPAIWVDAIEFVAKVELANPTASACESEIDLLTKAVALYRADFLAGFMVRNAADYETWQVAQRNRLRKLMVSALQLAGRYWLSKNAFGKAIPIARSVLQLEPWNEDAHRQLMVMLTQSGQRHSALVEYETLRKTLESELGVAPSAQTVELYQQIRNGDLDKMTRGQGGKMTGEQGDKMTDSRTTPVILSPPHPITPSPQLFGVDAARDDLLAHLHATDRPWILSIDGIGGIGKTSLAQSLVSNLTERGRLEGERFSRIVWLSAKQEEFRAGFGIQPTGQAALDVNQLVDELLEQLTEHGLASSPQEKERQLASLLKDEPTLVVIDNLETVADYEVLVPTLQELANPSKFLLTSRHTLSGYSDVYSLTLGELAVDDTLGMLRHEAAMRGIRGLSEASDDAIEKITTRIMQVVGGHPLALNLVLGQLSFLPLDQVLTSLEQAIGEQVDEFYTYIYWQGWHALDRPARQLFLAMPMLYNATYSQISEVSRLSVDDLQSALAQLIGLSLVQLSGDLLEPRYRLHRLTETFLMNEVIKWNQE